jgi:glycosyltransferase involved in cell wall biosynthesis
MVDLVGERQADHVVVNGARRPGRRRPGADRRKAVTEAPDNARCAMEAVEISVVMPCLNEEESVGICVRKAWEGIHKTGRTGEVIVADNGSTDRSVEVARSAGARVIHQPVRGYGNAYLAGFAVARGSIIVMGDADNSYDFTAIDDLVAPMVEQGLDYVHGSRFTGQIERGAMSWSHRYIGNPVLTRLLNVLFKLQVNDAHSGFRVFTRDALQQMDLQCEGMEFASEIVVKAARANLKVTEVPITYHPRIGESKLNSMSDAWRHISFLVRSSPLFERRRHGARPVTGADRTASKSLASENQRPFGITASPAAGE